MTEETLQVVALAEERVTVAKRTVEKSHVRVHVVTREELADIKEQLYVDDVDVERVPRNEFVDAVPAVREEGNVTVYPVVEEVLMKRLLLREELRVTRTREVLPYVDTVLLKRQTATVERSLIAETSIDPQTIKLP